MASGKSNTIGATQTTYRVIEGLKQLDGAGVTELATYLELSKSAVYKHLQTLRALDYVQKTGTTYQLSLQFADLGTFVQSSQPLYNVARPQLENLARVSGKCASLFVEEAGDAVCLYSAGEIEGLSRRVGKRRPMTTTAPGRAILAELSTTERENLLQTDERVSSSDEIHRAELSDVRDRGIAFDRNVESRDATERSFCSVATPISSGGDPVGAVAVTGHASELSGKHLQEDTVGLVLSTATSIETSLENRL